MEIREARGRPKAAAQVRSRRVTSRVWIGVSRGNGARALGRTAHRLYSTPTTYLADDQNFHGTRHIPLSISLYLGVIFAWSLLFVSRNGETGIRDCRPGPWEMRLASAIHFPTRFLPALSRSKVSSHCVLHTFLPCGVLVLTRHFALTGRRSSHHHARSDLRILI